jgi:hypothetical protein
LLVRIILTVLDDDPQISYPSVFGKVNLMTQLTYACSDAVHTIGSVSLRFLPLRQCKVCRLLYCTFENETNSSDAGSTVLLDKTVVVLYIQPRANLFDVKLGSKQDPKGSIVLYNNNNAILYF